jgi:hypothetical protein
MPRFGCHHRFISIVILENFVGPGLFCAQTAEANAEVGLVALDVGVTPGSRQASKHGFAVPSLAHGHLPPSQGQPVVAIFLPRFFYAARRSYR